VGGRPCASCAEDGNDMTVEAEETVEVVEDEAVDVVEDGIAGGLW